MFNMAEKLAKAGYVEPGRVKDASHEQIARECGKNGRAALKRVDSDFADRAAAIRFIRTESRKRWQVKAAEFDKLTPPAVRKGSVPYYTPDREYKIDEELRHDGFGDGRVIAVERRRVVVRFDSGEITLSSQK